MTNLPHMPHNTVELPIANAAACESNITPLRVARAYYVIGKVCATDICLPGTDMDQQEVLGCVDARVAQLDTWNIRPHTAALLLMRLCVSPHEDAGERSGARFEIEESLVIHRADEQPMRRPPKGYSICAESPSIFGSDADRRRNPLLLPAPIDQPEPDQIIRSHWPDGRYVYVGLRGSETHVIRD